MKWGSVARLFSKKFYDSKRWQDTRKAYIISKFGICERCGKPNSKQVHHKILLNETNINDPDVTLNFKNLELLCDICHQLEHNEKVSPIVAGLKFNDEGQLIKVDNKI